MPSATREPRHIQPQPPAPQRAEIRKLDRSDTAEIEAHLLRLDPHNRHLRFCSPAGDDFIRQHCARRDWQASVLVGAYVGGTLCGIGEMTRLGYLPQVGAEIALSVEAPYQNAGLGTRILRHLLTLARNRFIGRVYMLCLADNTKIQKIARKFDAELIRHPGEVEGRIAQPWPSYGSVIEEAAADGWALYHAVFDPAVVGDPPDR